MIAEITMYTIECDSCKATIGQDSEYSCWNDENYALDEAIDHDWIEHEGNHYCPNCYKIGLDDTITLKQENL